MLPFSLLAPEDAYNLESLAAAIVKTERHQADIPSITSLHIPMLNHHIRGGLMGRGRRVQDEVARHGAVRAFKCHSISSIRRFRVNSGTRVAACSHRE